MTSPAHFLLKPLPPAACLGVVAPAGPPKPGVLAQVAPMIEQLGFRPKLFPGCAGPAELGHLAAADAQRLADLHAAFADPEVDAVLCLRGGYGCIRLLEGLDLELLRRHPKPLIGYSDITSLHGALDRLGLPAWHAPMPASDWIKPGGMDDAQRLAAQLRRGLRVGEVLAPEGLPAHPLSQGGRARGRLIGGNLSVLVSSLGTRWMPDPRGAILFLEDIAEDPYRVDRYLAQLRLAGVLDAAAGFLLGSFSDADAPDAVLADYLPRLGKPILAGWPSGHCCPNLALPLGVELELDVAARCLRA